MYKSNWLPRPTTFRPISPKTLAVNAKVADLISSDRKWKTDIIQQHFVQDDVDIIFENPVSLYGYRY